MFFSDVFSTITFAVVATAATFAVVATDNLLHPTVISIHYFLRKAIQIV